MAAPGVVDDKHTAEILVDVRFVDQLLSVDLLSARERGRAAA